MIRFHCSHCNKALKVSEEKAGTSLLCPRCFEHCLVPSGEDSAAAPPPPATGPSREVTHPMDEVRSLFSGMSPRMRGLIFLCASLAFLSLLLAGLASVVPLLARVTTTTLPLGVLLILITLVLLYGQASSCPSCGKWWAREKLDTEFVDREVFDRQGTRYARATYRTNYACTACRGRWGMTYTEEYRDFIKDRRKGKAEKAKRSRPDEW